LYGEFPGYQKKARGFLGNQEMDSLCQETIMTQVRSLHTPAAQAPLPRFLFAGLENRTLDLTGFVLWTVIRFHAPDQEPGTFSPPPVALTNRELARMTHLSRRHVINVLNALEAAGWLHRLTREEQEAQGLNGPRWLQLTRPAAMKTVSGVNVGTVQAASGQADTEGVQSGAVPSSSSADDVRVLTDADRYSPPKRRGAVERYG
jgi:hypothetical protein